MIQGDFLLSKGQLQDEVIEIRFLRSILRLILR